METPLVHARRRSLSRIVLAVLCLAVSPSIHGEIARPESRHTLAAMHASQPSSLSVFYLVDASGNLGTVDAATGAATRIGNTGAILTDLAITASGAIDRKSVV